MKELGIYVHIPFCKSKCYYCDFTSYSNKENWIDIYIKQVIKEIQQWKDTAYTVSSIYIGGGTPSFINSKYILEILNTIYAVFPNINQNIEITLEINPGTATKEKLKEYKTGGVNRLSIGLQSSNDSILKIIGRIHTKKEFITIYEMARSLGFVNINVDGMINLPGQTNEDIENMLELVIGIKPEHISIYSLMIEENTKMWDMIQKGSIVLAEDETERKMYWQVKEKLEKNGYIHYEISNFAKKTYESRHNLNCWKQKEYIGYGVAAHSYLNQIRYSKTEDIERYIKGELKPKVEEIQTKEQEQNEFMLLGLRMINGISILEFQEKFQVNPLKKYRNTIENLQKESLIEITKYHIRLSKKGLDFANLVWEKFI